ncbi:CHASE2 domain-containing protein [Kaistia nematophila]|uniref:Adenylate/guanylate cyclase domain-containing protein n=1 Tax=Kaistia nematophila TaxID=2994654 RepID=A0A9X3E568_9HYPH|nr:adenylate/guanylate cyclase domain-containing protein [Kaistia nematophila]MCX5570967.1 adenylate/guanylate cyclase domain-containing protein [Kaistia nematophila]
MRFLGRPVYYLAVAVFLAGAALLRVADPFPVQAIRLLAFDLYQRMAPAEALPEHPVLIVDIDEASLKAVGQWPWPRTVLADLARKLAEAGAASIAFDVLFSEPDQSSPEEVVKRLPPEQATLVAASIGDAPTHDRVFADALAATPSVLGLSLSGSGAPLPPLKAGFATAGDDPRPFIANFAGAIANVPVLDEAAKGIGSINWLQDRDQIVRRVPLVFRVGDALVPSLAAEALRVAQDAGSYILKGSNASGEAAFGRETGLNHVRIGALVVPTDADGAIWLRFRPSDPEGFVSAKDVLDGSIPAHLMEGRIALVGTSAAGLLDLRATPLDSAVPGVEIHAQVIEHILTGRSLTRPDFSSGVEIAVIVGLGLLLALILPHVSAVAAAILGALAVGGILVGGFLAYLRLGLLFDPFYPALAIILLVIGSVLYTFRQAERARAGIRRAFQHYVAPAVVDEIIADPSRLELGGEMRELTLLFCDVRNFTTLAEGMSATELTGFINELMAPLSEIILNHRGTIDKYMGDAVMAFWNAPLDDPDHARHALEAAEAMMAAMAGLNAGWQRAAAERGRAMPEVRIGIGINTGACCVGNLGTAQRFDYSAIGDEVNIASRLEQLTKDYGLGIIVGEATARAAGKVGLVEIDRIQVRGRSGMSRIFTLAPPDAEPDFAEAQRAFAAALPELDPSIWRSALYRAKSAAPARFARYYHFMLERLSARGVFEGQSAPHITIDL